MSLVVVVVCADLLGTYGDGGNGVILARRAAWRGIPVDLVMATSDEALPMADIYCLGGGEDGPQVRAAEMLRSARVLNSAVDAGAAVLAVCAGYQIIGTSFPDSTGEQRDGVGLLDIDTRKGRGPRAVGELLAEPYLEGIPTLTGFENHAGVTTLGPQVEPLAHVEIGVGNGTRSNWAQPGEGARVGRVIGTYLHGPVLARNPALADLVLQWGMASKGDELAALDPLEDGAEEELRAERLVTVRRAHGGGVRRMLRPRGRGGVRRR